ncbi:PD40 domain-containing protein [Aggregatilinea lenta]|uniref:PD40 domain-containing protein n=1 Tax=Aggregatilinea lenta TaxID=913108 RepID=UPI000E5B67D6|nr:PD40 domain-containing protein [Aggregatilinea lenta]
MAQDPQSLLREAIQAAQHGNPTAARLMLEQVIGIEPENELAWIWLATVAETNAQRKTYLTRVLEINPNNARAQQALAKLQSSASTPRRAAAQPPRPRAETSRRRISPLYVLVFILALLMIAVGVLLLYNTLNEDDEPEPTPSTAAAVATAPSEATSTAAIATPSGTPRPTSQSADRTAEPLPPTWTPTPTWTPSPEAQPTQVPDLDSYTLLVSQYEDDIWHLITMRADTTGIEAVSFNLPNDLTTRANLEWTGIYDADYSPDGQQIVAVVSLRERPAEDSGEDPVEFTELFTAPADGGDLRQLTSLRAEVSDPTWSPDGTQIAFASNAEGDFDIYAVDTEGGEPRVLTGNSGEDRSPTWSPDGAQIVFASDLAGPGALEVWQMPAAGGDPVQLTESGNSSFAPAFSPDGNRIAFISDRGGDNDLYVMNADGTGERILTTNDDADAFDPAWSPDSEWISYSATTDGEGYQLAVIHPDGTGLETLTEETTGYRYTAWSPVQ